MTNGYPHADDTHRPQLAACPAAMPPACLARLSLAAISLTNSIIDFSVTLARRQHRPTAGHANTCQWTANPPKSASFFGQNSPKGELTWYPPRSTILPHFIAVHQPTPKILLTKNVADKQRNTETVNDSPTLPIGMWGIIATGQYYLNNQHLLSIKFSTSHTVSISILTNILH